MIKLVVLLMSLKSFAMCVSKSFDVLDWNLKGDAVLINKTSHGPEGGGDKSYLIIDFTKKEKNVYTLSSNFSPGDGSKPERVTVSECKERVEKVNEILESKNFKVRLGKNLTTCVASRNIQLEGKDNTENFQLKDKTEEIIKRLVNKIKTPVVSSKDNIHFIVYDSKMGCSAKCYKVSLKDHNYLEGECIR